MQMSTASKSGLQRKQPSLVVHSDTQQTIKLHSCQPITVLRKQDTVLAPPTVISHDVLWGFK